jgi:hypothetical protein
MLELVFVIVIMGIIGKFGVEFLAQSYRTFIHAKINNELHTNSANTLQFIAKRLEYRIVPSVIKRISTVNGFAGATEIVANPDTYNVLEWIAYDSDGFRGTTAPLWSGIVDLDPSLSTTTNLRSVDTNTTAMDTLIDTLSDGGSGIEDTAIMFTAENYNPNSFGWAEGDALVDQTQAMHPVNSGTTVSDFASGIADDFTDMKINNRYMLAWTAYAIVHDGTNLTLYYNYQPWHGENYLQHGTPQVLMENVSTFRIRTNPSGGIFSIMVCAKSDLIVGEEHSICKEKVIF